MLCNVSRHSPKYSLLKLGVLPNQLLDVRVFHRRHMHDDVCLVVLVQEGLDRLALEDVHVLRHGVARFHVVFNGYKLLVVLDAKHVQHLTMQDGEVIQLWGRLC